jgi:hypothetical protein
VHLNTLADAARAAALISTAALNERASDAECFNCFSNWSYDNYLAKHIVDDKAKLLCLACQDVSTCECVLCATVILPVHPMKSCVRCDEHRIGQEGAVMTAHFTKDNKKFTAAYKAHDMMLKRYDEILTMKANKQTVL